MANLKGNPEFGKKYRAERKTKDALSEQVSTRVPTEVKSQLKEIAGKEKCSIPDVVRQAIQHYLKEVAPENVA